MTLLSSIGGVLIATSVSGFRLNRGNVEFAVFVIDMDQASFFQTHFVAQPIRYGHLEIFSFNLSNSAGTFNQVIASRFERNQQGEFAAHLQDGSL
jgi:hypothetical protein